MADVATPAAIAGSGIPFIIFAGAIGLDPLSMGAGLTGVVIVQTLLPPTAQGVRAIMALGIGSMLLASIAAPFVGPATIAILPNWNWLAQVEPQHVKVASAAFVGGFAQPMLLWIRSLLPYKPSEPVKEK